MDALVIFLVCTLSGTLTGMLSIGGGLVIVPMFLTVLPFVGVNLSIHQIIGVSASCILINSLVCVFYRRKEKFLPKPLVIKLSIAIAIGTLCSTYLTSFATKEFLLWVYIFVAVISLALMWNDVSTKAKYKKFEWLLYPIFAFIGALCASIGIGGATIFVAALKIFTDKNSKELLPTLTLFVLVAAVFTVSGKIILGFVSWRIIPIAFCASILGTKIGIILSRKLTPIVINRLMCSILILSLLRIIAELFA